MIASLLVGSAFAGEGMWLPGQLSEVADRLATAGYPGSAAELGQPGRPPLAAIVGLGFCSASLVSGDGLVITNTHCVESYLGQTSTPELNRIDLGFTAPSRAEELPAGPAARLGIVESITDVTDTIEKVVRDPKITDVDRVAAVDRAKSRLVSRCENQGRVCEVVSQFGGRTWQLVRSLELRDVRIVYAPPSNVAYFGGDLDNFEWPRHDADFAILRIYVAPDGKPADPSPANVPYHPPHWLRMSTAGVAEGDFVMAAGYPGQTDRYALPEALRFLHDVALPWEITRFAETERFLAEAMKDPVAASALQSTANEVANGRKYTRGLQDNVSGSTLLADKDALARRLDAWLAADPSRTPVAEAVRELRRLVGEEAATWRRDDAIGALLQIEPLGSAHRAYRWAVEHAKRPDADRDPGYQDRDRDEVAAALEELDETLWLPVERRLFEARLAHYASLAASDRAPSLDQWVAQHGGSEAATEQLFADPALARSEARLALLDRSRAELEASTDPWVTLAVALERGHLEAARRAEEAREGARLRITPLYVGAMREVVGGASYPDANNTLRVTFGTVTGYAPRDGLVATPKTSLAGLVAKHRTDRYEAPPFLADAALRASANPTDADRRWFDPALGQVPVNFLSDVDTTGGNSGSATLNAAGEFVGLVFDGNYESMAADWQFDPGTTRTVHVDTRYIGWLLSQDPRSEWILAELTQP